MIETIILVDKIFINKKHVTVKLKHTQKFQLIYNRVEILHLLITKN